MYDPKSQRKYSKKCKKFTVNYKPYEIEEALTIELYLSKSNQSANKYIKSLIHKDLQERGLIGEKHDE